VVVEVLGPGVIQASYAGLETVTLEDIDYVCKPDLDLPRRYVELLMERMEANPRLGNTSGKPYFIAPGNRNQSQLHVQNDRRVQEAPRSRCGGE